MSNLADWFQITIKFRGKCFECGKEITSGQQALWSKSIKAIKHLEDCSIRNAADLVTSSSKDSEESITHKQEIQFIRKQKKFLQASISQCFICRKEKPRDDKYDSNDYDYEDNSQSYICQSCLEREDAFEAYSQAFLQKINKYLKRMNEVYK
jgi:hypothetical protein